MKYAIYVTMLYGGVVLQTALLPHINILGARPDLISALLVVLAIVLGPLVGGVAGAVAGLMLDFMFMYPGFYMSQYFMLGLLVGILARYMPFGKKLLPVTVGFASFLLKETITLVYLYLQRAEVDFSAVIGRLLMSSLFTMLLVLPLYCVVKAIAGAKMTREDTLF